MKNNDLIINYGGVLLDVDEQSTGGFETSTLWDFGREETQGKGRSLDLSVPATKKNRKTLNFYDIIPSEGVRRGIEGAVICGGVAIDGTVFVTGFSGGRFNLMIAYGRKFAGFDGGNYALQDTITYDKHSVPATSGAIPAFGWYEYGNFFSPHATTGIIPELLPCANLGHIITSLATAAGYTVNYPAVSLGRQYQADAYGLVLPSFGLRGVWHQIDITGNAMNGYTASVIGGDTLAEAGLELSTSYFRRGQIPQSVKINVFITTREVSITLPANSGIVMCGGDGYIIYNNWEGTHGVTFRFRSGARFALVSANEWHAAGKNNYWNRLENPPAYEGNITVSLQSNYGAFEYPQDGDTMYLAEALPQKTLEEWLNIYANLIAGVWTVDDVAKEITIKTYSELVTAAFLDTEHHIALENERVTGIESVKRYVEGFAQHNYTRCEVGKDYPNRYTRDLRCYNDYLQEENELSEIPITAGDWMDSSDPAVIRLMLDDVRQDDSGLFVYNGELALFFENNVSNDGARHIVDTLNMGVGEDLQALVENGSSVSVKLLMPLFRFAGINERTCVSMHGRNFVVRNAKWSGGIAQLDLITTATQMLQIPRYFPNSIQDYDGNWYDAVVVGNQVWLAQNLRTTHYADGTPIPAGGSTTSDTDPYYYDYNSSGIPLKDRGLLYNWPAVMNGAASSDLNPSGVQGIAPTGWHVPSDAEWTQLTNYVGSVPEYRLDNNHNYIAKALASQSYWNASTVDYAIGNDLTANNKTLFGGVPAGISSVNAKISMSFWCARSGFTMFAIYNDTALTLFGRTAESSHSVRCVCDLSPMDFAAWYYNQYGSYNHQL